MSLETPINIRMLQRKLYSKAKETPDRRFYLLYDKICRQDILSHAYRFVKANKGAPGVDGQTLPEIESNGPGGGERPLGIPTIRDRVVQTAAKLVLEPMLEEWLAGLLGKNFAPKHIDLSQCGG